MLTSVLKGMAGKRVITLLAVLFTCCQIIVGEETLYRIEPRQNLWVTWVNKMGQSAFCLSLASATEPFRTCLIGVPSFNVIHFTNYSEGRCTKAIQMSSCSAELIQGLNCTLPCDPQELNLLGSIRIGNTTKNWTQTCFVFAGPAIARPNHLHFFNQSGWANVTPIASYYDYQGHSRTVTFCGTNDTNKRIPQSLGAYGMEGGSPL